MDGSDTRIAVDEVTTDPDAAAAAPPASDGATASPQVEPPVATPLTRSRRFAVGIAYALAIVVGATLIVAAALTQPYNQNELQQVNAYRLDDFDAAVSGTRQPPLGPALGVAVQRMVGIGQLEQRLESVLPGIGTLVVLAALFWRLRLGAAGAAALWVVATTPLMVRYSAYARPYALPVFLMLLCAYLVHRWLDRGGVPRLLGLLLVAAALPASRVPEPTVFLGTVAVTLLVLGVRGRHPWRRVLPPLVAVVFALVAVAYPMYRALEAATSDLAEADPLAVLSNLGPQVNGLVTILPRVLAEAFPWWPLSLAVAVAAVALPAARRWLARTWVGPVVAVPPIVWAVYYHLAIQTPAEGIFGMIYRPRFAYFFVPPFAFAVAALARRATDPTARWWLRSALAALLVALFVTQLPATARVLREHDTADWAAGARMVAALPDDAVVIYDNVSPIGSMRQGFTARPRYLDDTQRVMVANLVIRGPRGPDKDRPLYVLLLGPSPLQPGCGIGFGEPIAPRPGWRLRAHEGRFSLFEPVGDEAPTGAADTLLAYGRAFPPRCGATMTAAGAALHARYGGDAKARAELRELLAATPADDRTTVRSFITNRLPDLAAGLDRLPSP